MATYYMDSNGNFTKKKQNKGKTYVMSSDGSFTKRNDEEDEEQKKRNQERLEALFERGRQQKEAQAESKKAEGGLEFFKASGAWDDGYQIGDVTKATLGTVGDTGLQIGKGAAGLGEGITDAILYGAAGLFDLKESRGITFDKDDPLYEKPMSEKIRDLAKQDSVENTVKPAEEYLDNYSVLGRTSKAVAQGVGQVGAILATGGMAGAAGFGSAGATALTTAVTGISGFGSGTGEAYKGGATDKEAYIYGAIAGASDALTELLFGGLGKSVKAVGLSSGVTSLDDIFASKVSGVFKNQIAKNLTEYGIKAGAEGFEEVLAGLTQAIGKKITYMSEEDLGKIIEDENLLEQLVVGAVTSGIAQSGVVPGMKNGSLIEANKTGRDFITGNTQNEQAVIDAEINKRIAEAEKDGEKLTGRQKNKIIEQVKEDMEKGYISTDTIEEVLGGVSYNQFKQGVDDFMGSETYKAYNDAIAEEKSLREEFEELQKVKVSDADLGQQSRFNEVKSRLEEIKKEAKSTTLRRELQTEIDRINGLKKKLTEEVSKKVENERLSESYRELQRSTEKFQADPMQYDNEYARKTVQNIVDSGIANNTNETREFVDFMAKLSADKGVVFSMTDAERLAGTRYAKDGVTTNGYVTSDGEIVINKDSKKRLNSVVGHEVTHVLEGTELYTKLQEAVIDYAKKKGDYDSRLKAITELYEKHNPEADPTKELTADLVGDYLFTDRDFINKLSTEHRNVFQKIYDEIKYLVKVATAGSKEARALEKAKKMFEAAYRENVKGKPQAETNFSLAETIDGRRVAVVDSDILSKIDTSTWDKTKKDAAKKAAVEALKKLKDGIVVNGITHKVNKQSRNEYTRSNYTEGLYKKAPDVFADKMRAADVADDVVIAVTDWNRDGELKHPRTDKFVDFAHGRTLIAAGNAKYSAEVVVGITESGEAVFYDVVDMVPTTFDIKKAESSTAATTQEAPGDIQEDSGEAIITQNSEKSIGEDEKNLSESDAERLKDAGLDYDEKSETVSFSLSSLEDSFGYNKGETEFFAAKNEYVNALANSIAETKGKPSVAETEKARRYLDSLFLIHDMIAADRDRLDFEAAVDKSAWVSNSEYGGSIDFSTLCAKRRLFTGTFDAIQEALPNAVLNENDFLTIRNMLLEKDLESPCSMCYVEGSRAKHGEYVAKWLKEYLATNPEWKPQIADFTSSTRLEQTRINHPEAYKAYQTAMNKLAQRKPKEASIRTDYKGEILTAFEDDTTVEAKNKNGGVRFNSFSDFEIIHALDAMQVITDMARVGLNGQAYTKVKEFAEAFGNTGLKINLSLVAKDVDADGKLVFDEINGMNYAEAMDIRSRYSENVGSVIVVFNDTQLKAALADGNIDYVLPFHRSQWKKSQYAMMGLPTQTKDYTMVQNDRTTNPTTGKPVKLSKLKQTTTYSNDVTGETFEIKDNIMPNQYWDFSKSGRENANRYLDYINANGMTPKFDSVLEKVDGKWVLPEGAVGDGYYKLLIDFKMYDNNGWGAPQKPVLPEFNMPYIQNMLKDYTGGHKAFPVAHDVVDAFVQSKQGVKHSLSANGDATKTGGGYAVYGDNIRVRDKSEFDFAPLPPVQETVQETSTVTDTEDYPIMENSAPMTEEEANSYDGLEGITDADAPPVMDAPYYGENEDAAPTDPFEDRDIKDVGNRKVKAYMYENPEVKPFFQEEANIMLGELQRTTKGERFYNMDVYYETNGEAGITGTSRNTSDDIAYLLDELKYSYKQIESGLRAIIEDNGKENNAVSKRIEFLLNDRLMNGYQDFEYGLDIPPNQDYVNLLNEKQIQEYNDEARKKFFETADDFAPPIEAPLRDMNPTLTEVFEDTPIKGRDYEAVTPKKPKENRLARRDVGTPEEQQIARILDEEPTPENRESRAWARFVANVFDKGAVFEKVALKNKNRELMGKWNYMLYSEARAQNLIGNGTDYVKSLNSIQEEVGASGKTKEFYEYLYHKHNVDRMNLADRYEGKENLPVFGYSVTSEMSDAAARQLEAANPEFVRYAQDIYDYNEHLRQLLVDNGVISQETADMWAEMYPHYVPIRRAGDKSVDINVPLDTGRTTVNAPVKRATGGNSDILPLFDTMAQRTIQTYKAIAKNSFGVELKNTLGTTIEANPTDVDDVIDTIDAQDGLLQEGKNGRNPTFTVFEDGERVTYEITKDMYDALKPMSEGLAYTNKALNTASNFHRGLLTEYNPVFMLTNALKDAQDLLINSQHPVRTYAKIPEAVGQLASKGYWYKEYMANGGEQNSYFDNETNTLQTGRKGVAKLLDLPPLSTISALNNFIEMTPRLAEYIASREAGRSVEVSMLDAARVTTNFRAGGEVTKFLNRNGATFLNASVQGFAQQVRNVREAKHNGLKGVAGLIAKFAIAGLPAAILNNLVWDDDDEYEELSDYVKQNYYVIGKYGDGKFIRIPKGRTIAVIQDAINRVIDIATGDDEADLNTFLEMAAFGLSNLAPNNPIENNIAAPIIQIANNETWYGEDLVPSRLQDLPPAEQFDESTDAFSKWLGQKINVSPVKINYFLDQYSGGLGDTVLPMMTPEAESGDNSLVGNLLAPLKSKFTTDSVMNNQNVSDFYDKKDELTTNAKASGATDKDILKNKYMNSVNADIADLYAQKREIQNSSLSDKEKYEQVKAIQNKIVNLTRESLDAYENVKIDGEYATVGDKYFKLDDEGEWRKMTDEQVTKHLITSEAEARGESYGTNGTVHYRLTNKGEWMKISDKQLERQREVTKALGITPSEYWSKTDIMTVPMPQGEYEMAYDSPEKYDYLNDQGISYDEYASSDDDTKAAHSWAANYPDKYAVSKAVTNDVVKYKTYTKALSELKSDKDSEGKSISGSRKEKVLNYINGLNINYGEKLVLFKSEYPADDTYNYEIIDYLNSRSDLTSEEIKTILTELDFKVDDDGNITW